MYLFERFKRIELLFSVKWKWLSKKLKQLEIILWLKCDLLLYKSNMKFLWVRGYGTQIKFSNRKKLIHIITLRKWILYLARFSNIK